MIASSSQNVTRILNIKLKLKHGKTEPIQVICALLLAMWLVELISQWWHQCINSSLCAFAAVSDINGTEVYSSNLHLEKAYK